MEKKLRIGMLLGFVAFGLDAVVSTLIFPLLLRFLGQAQAGVWMLLVSIGAIFTTLLSGTGPVVIRMAAFVAGRKKEADFEDAEWAQARANISALYVSIGMFTGVIALAAIPLYWKGVALDNKISFGLVSLAWLGYFLGWLLRMWAHRNFCCLDGVGEVGLNRAYNSGAGAANLLLLLLFLPLISNLTGPVLSYTLIAGALWWLSGKVVESKVSPAFFRRARPEWPKVKELAVDSLKIAVLSVTSYVTTQSSILFVEHMQGVSTLALYAPVLRVIFMMAMVAGMPSSIIFSYVARSWAEKDSKKFFTYSLIAAFAGPMLYIVPGLILFLYPEKIIIAWLGENHYIGTPVVRLLIFYGFIFTLHSAIATPAIAARHKTFVGEALLNTACVLGLMLWLPRVMGVEGFPLAMILGTLPASALVLFQSLKFIRHPFR